MAELAQQAKMVTPLQPTPVDNAPASVSVTSFRLPGFDPDKISFAVTEWLEDATRLKTDDGLELHHDRLNPYKVLTIKNDDQNNINVSGMDEQNVQLHHIATGVPGGNGKVERVMRTVFNLLRATLTAEKEKTRVDTLPDIENNINTTVHSSTGFSPMTLQFGTNPRLPATQQFLGDAISTENVVGDPDATLTQAREQITGIGRARAVKFDSSRFAAKLFGVGDLVAVEDSQVAGGGKLKPKYSGPYTVRKVLMNERYLLWKKGKRTTVAAHEQQHKYHVNNTQLKPTTLIFLNHLFGFEELVLTHIWLCS
jgi:hypothetical protein